MLLSNAVELDYCARCGATMARMLGSSFVPRCLTTGIRPAVESLTGFGLLCRPPQYSQPEAVAIVIATIGAHLITAALHPTLALLSAAVWATMAAVSARTQGSQARAGWLTLFAAMQLCTAAAGSLALLAWHRLPWKHRTWADPVEAVSAAGAGFCAAIVCATEVMSRQWIAPNRSSGLPAWRSVFLPASALVSVATVALSMRSVSLCVGSSDTAYLPPSVLSTCALCLLYIVSPDSIDAYRPERTHID